MIVYQLIIFFIRCVSKFGHFHFSFEIFSFFNNKSPPDIVPRTIAFNVTDPATVPRTTKATEPMLF